MARFPPCFYAHIQTSPHDSVISRAFNNPVDRCPLWAAHTHGLYHGDTQTLLWNVNGYRSTPWLNHRKRRVNRSRSPIRLTSLAGLSASLASFTLRAKANDVRRFNSLGVRTGRAVKNGRMSTPHQTHGWLRLDFRGGRVVRRRSI